MTRSSGRTRKMTKGKEEDWFPFMGEKKGTLLAQDLPYRYDKRRHVNVTVKGGRTRPVILIPSSVASLKTVRKDVRGED